MLPGETISSNATIRSPLAWRMTSVRCLVAVSSASDVVLKLTFGGRWATAIAASEAGPSKPMAGK